MLGLAGVCVICVSQILTLLTFDLALRISLGCFSVAVPLLTTVGLMNERLLDYSSYDDRCEKIVFIPMGIGGFLALIGLTSVFCHFHWLFGLLFIAATIVGVVAMFKLDGMLGPPNKRVDSAPDIEASQH